jgi:YVTN family beta-propeller protein
VNPDGSKVYVSNFNSASVSVIDTASNTVQATISVGFSPLGLSSSPDGTRLYVADYDAAVNNGSVAVIDTATNHVLTRVALPQFHTARRVAISPDGTRGYVTINIPQTVLMFDTATNLMVGEEIPIDGIPEGIAITPAPIAQVPFSWLRAELRETSKLARVFLSGVFQLGMHSDGIEIESEPARSCPPGPSGALATTGQFSKPVHVAEVFGRCASSQPTSVASMCSMRTSPHGTSSTRHRVPLRYCSRSVTTAGTRRRGVAAVVYLCADEWTPDFSASAVAGDQDGVRAHHRRRRARVAFDTGDRPALVSAGHAAIAPSTADKSAVLVARSRRVRRDHT